MAYLADASTLEAGSIIKIEAPLDSTRKPTHPHFFIVLMVPAPLRAGSNIPVIGVSSSIRPSAFDPSTHVAMKWLARHGGDPETGFFKPCYACVDFTGLLTVRKGEQFPLEVAVEHQGKFIRSEKLQTVVATMNAFARRGST